MYKHGYEEINFNNPLMGKIGIVKDCLIDFYGEKYKDRINSRIDNTLFVFLDRASDEGLEVLQGHFGELLENSSIAEQEYLTSEKERISKEYYNSSIKIAQKEYVEGCEKVASDFLVDKMGIEPTEKNLEAIKNLVPTYVEYITGKQSSFNDVKWSNFKFMLTMLANLTGEIDGNKITVSGKEKINSISDDKLTIDIKKKLIELDDIRRNAILSDESFDKAIKDIENLNLIGGENLYDFIADFALNTESVGGGQFSSVSLDEPNKTKGVCINSSARDLIDSQLIHEINHAVSSSCKLSGNFLNSKSGFCFKKSIHLSNGKMVDLVPWSRYIAINEVTNEFLAQKIHGKLEERGVKFGVLGREKANYSLVFPVLENFLEEHLEDIKESFIGDDHMRLANSIGEENFNALADLATSMLDFCEKFDNNQRLLEKIKAESGKGENFDIFDVAYDGNINWNNENIEKYLQFVRDVDDILFEIDEYVDYER